MKAQQAFISLDSRHLLLTAFGFDRQASECTVIVPPFAEELNKCRRMMALQASALAATGRACCYLDLSGTGDSEGSFAQARWQHWVAELCGLLDELRATHGFDVFDLIGIRLGFQLALDVAARSTAPISQIVGWQPVTDGAAHAKQFLRLRVMAAMLGDAAGRESLADLRRELDEEGVLEIAGYTVAAPLLAAIEALTLERALQQTDQPLAWFEVQAQPEPTLSPASRRTIASIPAERLAAVAAVSGEPFWSTVEIGLAPALIERTTARLTGV